MTDNNHILPECCQHCVEADGFLGAKGCNNRECECHVESHERERGTVPTPPGYRGESHEGVEEIFNWLLGESDDFRERREGEGAYWWRKELRERISKLSPLLPQAPVEELLREFEQRYAPRWKTAIRENETVELPLDAYEHAATIGDAVSWLRTKLTSLNTKKHE